MNIYIQAAIETAKPLAVIAAALGIVWGCFYLFGIVATVIGGVILTMLGLLYLMYRHNLEEIRVLGPMNERYKNVK